MMLRKIAREDNEGHAFYHYRKISHWQSAFGRYISADGSSKRIRQNIDEMIAAITAIDLRTVNIITPGAP